MNDYTKLVLIERNIDLNSLDENTFSEILYNDFVNAVKKHRDIVNRAFDDDLENRLNKVRKDSEEYARSKWKRESRIQQYIEEMCIKESLRGLTNYNFALSFSFDHSFGTENSSIILYSEYDINPEKRSKTTLKVCFNDLKSKYKDFFNVATGWRIYILYNPKYDKYFEAHFSNFELILPEEYENKIKENKEQLSKNIQEFYKGCKYFGD